MQNNNYNRYVIEGADCTNDPQSHWNTCENLAHYPYIAAKRGMRKRSWDITMDWFTVDPAVEAKCVNDGFKFEMLQLVLSYASLKRQDMVSAGARTQFKLKRGVKPVEVLEKMADLCDAALAGTLITRASLRDFDDAISMILAAGCSSVAVDKPV